MARDWVKLYACLWEDEFFTDLANDSLGIWTRMLAFAATADDSGRTRTPQRLARLLCQPVEAIEKTVADLDGRIVTDPDGVLRFRDWHDWQAQSGHERVRAHRERAAVTGGNGAKQDVTTSNDIEREKEKRKRREEKESVAKKVGDSTTEEPAAPAPKLGPGCRALKAVTHRVPPEAVRADVEAAFEAHGEAKLQAVAKEWVGKGFKAQNVTGILDVVAHGWQARANGSHNPAVVAHTDRSYTPLTPEELEEVRLEAAALPDIFRKAAGSLPS